jgi:hypothetical protein
VQLIEVASAPPGGSEAHPGDEAEQRHEDDESGPIHVSHGIPPNFYFASRPASPRREAYSAARIAD